MKSNDFIDRQEGLELFAQHIVDVTRAINNSNSANTNRRKTPHDDELGQQRRRACLSAGIFGVRYLIFESSIVR